MLKINFKITYFLLFLLLAIIFFVLFNNKSLTQVETFKQIRPSNNDVNTVIDNLFSEEIKNPYDFTSDSYYEPQMVLLAISENSKAEEIAKILNSKNFIINNFFNNIKFNSTHHMYETPNTIYNAVHFSVPTPTSYKSAFQIENDLTNFFEIDEIRWFYSNKPVSTTTNTYLKNDTPIIFISRRENENKHDIVFAYDHLKKRIL